MVLILDGRNGDGIMRVTAKQRFDREGNFPGKRVRVPIHVSDRQNKGSNQVVYLIIGDLVSLYKKNNIEIHSLYFRMIMT